MKKMNTVEKNVYDLIAANSGIKRRELGELMLKQFVNTDAAIEFLKQDKMFEEDKQILLQNRNIYGWNKNLTDDEYVVQQFATWVADRLSGKQKNCRTKPFIVKEDYGRYGSVANDRFYINSNYAG